jgi:APA family basic amino acid/polyamine antiporter
LPALSVVACIWLMLNLPVATWARFVVWMVLGLLIYLLYGVRRSRLARAESDRAVRDS